MEQGKKKILIVANSGPFHINKFHIPLISEMISDGHDVTIATEDIDSIPLDCSKVEVPFGLGISLQKTLKSSKELLKIRKNNNYDIIFTNTALASALVRIILGSFRKKTKIVYMAHGFHFHKEGSIINWALYYPLEKVLSSLTDIMIVINKEDYQLASKKFKAKRLCYVPGVGVNLDFFKNDAEFVRKDRLISKGNKIVKGRSPKLFYAADLNDNKNQILLLNALELLKNYYPECILYLAGTGNNEEKLKKFTKEFRLESNVCFLGYISKEQIRNYLKESDFVVASSMREGLPINIIEAMSMKKLIIATDVRGHKDLIMNGVNGYLVKQDPKLIVEFIIKLYENKELFNKVSEYAFLSSMIYDENKQLKRLKEIIIE